MIIKNETFFNNLFQFIKKPFFLSFNYMHNIKAVLTISIRAAKNEFMNTHILDFCLYFEFCNNFVKYLLNNFLKSLLNKSNNI